jgi:hypothetical protein
MPFSGGVFTRIYSWVADKNANIKITALRMDGEADDTALAINSIVSQDQPFTGPVAAPNGTVSLPGYTFDPDRNTGFYGKAADVIGVAAGGVNSVDLTSTGMKITAGGGTIDYFNSTTFTPVLVGTTTPGAGTYTVQTGNYLRIGGWVMFTLRMNWTAHTGTGNMEIQGLPFANFNVYASPASAVPINITIPAASVLYAQVNASASTIQLAYGPDVGGALTDVAIDAVGSINISGMYRVA